MSIKLKLVTLFLVFAALAIAIIGSLSYYNARNSLKRAHIATLEGISDLKVRHIEAFFQERFGDIVVAQDYFNIKKNLPAVSRFINDRSNPAYIQAKQELDGQLKTLQMVYYYKDVMLLSPEGVVVYGTSIDPVEAAEVGHPLHAPADDIIEEGENKPYLSEIFDHGNHAAMILSAPVHDSRGKFIGLVAFEIDTNYLYGLIQDATGLGETGETLIVRKDGNDAVFLNPLRHDPEAALKRRVTFGSSKAVPAQLALQGKTGSGIALVDYRGMEVLAAWRFIPSLGWGLVSKIDAEEAFKDIAHLRIVIILLVLVTLLIAVLIAFAIARSISRPIEELKAGAEVIGSGDLHYRTGSTANDEIGQLSRTLDRMAERLERTTASRDELNREITERIQIERELKDRTAQLHSSNEGLKQFAYIASHDMQEPLRMVSSYVQLLAKRYKGRFDPDADEFIRFAVEGTDRMQRLITDLLAYATIGGKARPLEPCDFAKVIDIVRLNLKLPIQESGAVIKCQPLPTVMADSSQMVQLLQNLVGNAIKYRSDRRPEIEISAERAGDAWKFAVRDNGIGIAPEFHERIFMIFQRLHGNGQYKGSGIGLASCARILERYGGRIWVESNPGEGSAFFFVMPDAGPDAGPEKRSV